MKIRKKVAHRLSKGDIVVVHFGNFLESAEVLEVYEHRLDKLGRMYRVRLIEHAEVLWCPEDCLSLEI